MYSAQTSMIPVQIALARFLESQGWQAIFGNYPYWYLGTTPYRFLTGPILPPVLALLHKILPNFSLFEIMFGVIAVCWVLGGVGVFLLVQALNHTEQNPSTTDGYGAGTEKHRMAVFAALFYLLGPIVPFLFRFSDGLYLIAFSILPYVLLLYSRFLQPQRRESEQKRKIGLLLCILIAFVILLDSLIIPSLLLGMAAIFLATTGWRRAEEKLKQSLWLMAYGLLLATFWYTPGYWLTLLGAPSLAGVGVLGVIGWLGKILPTVLALGMAVFSVKFFKKRNTLRDFCFYWLFIFGFLTLIRFLSDPDFWLDWSSYGTELQFGVAIALGMIASKIYSESKIRYMKTLFSYNLKSKILLFTFYFLLFTFLFNKYVLGTLQRDIEQTVEYRIGRQLSEIAKTERPVESPGGDYGVKVFLSGTTAFWLNAFFDIPQVRGGVDQASVDQNWRKAVWEIREGEDQQKSLEWFKKLKVEYLVVHTQESEEFYHDFSYPEKFEQVGGLKKIYEQNGDRIYQVLD